MFLQHQKQKQYVDKLDSCFVAWSFILDNRNAKCF